MPTTSECDFTRTATNDPHILLWRLPIATDYSRISNFLVYLYSIFRVSFHTLRFTIVFIHIVSSRY